MSALTVEQQQRADALRVAREVVARRPPNLPVEVDVLDLLAVASFVLTGVDPYASTTTRAMTRADQILTVVTEEEE